MSGLIPFGRRDLSGDSVFSMMDDFFRDTWMPFRSAMRDSFRVDLKEDDGKYTVEAELPGVKKEDIRLDFSDGRLTIAVVKDEQNDFGSESYVHRERRTSSMQRTLLLPDGGQEGADAVLAEGVLTVTVPKKEPARTTRKIEIR